MKEKLVSIVLVCYNHEKYIRETICSVLAQTYRNCEIIIMDDCSTDNSIDIINNFISILENYFPVVKFIIHEKNIGLPKTLNEALNLAEGEYIKFFATDDIMLPRLIEKSVAYLEQHNDCAMVYANHITNSNIIKLNSKVKHRSGLIYNDLLFRKFSISTPTSVIRKSVFDNVGFFDENLFIEDFDMWLRIAKNHKIGFINDYLVLYRVGNTNSLSNNYSKMETSQIKIIDKQDISDSDKKKAKRKFFILYCHIYFKKKDFSKFRYFYKKLFFHKELFNIKLFVKFMLSIGK